MHAALGLVALALLGIACGCPRENNLVPNRRTVGDLQYQIGSEVMTLNDFEVVGMSAVFLGDNDAFRYPPGNLSFRFSTGDPRQPNSTPPPFAVTVIVKNVSPGASEIDLDDERADVSARPFIDPDTQYHDVAGHLSIRELVQDCAWNCPMRANGTMNVSAVGPNGETFMFTAVTFSAADEVHEGACLSEQ